MSEPLAGHDEREPADLRRGMNLGNALDTVREGERGLRLDERYFDAIRDAGFDTVRLPVKWSAHAEEAAPFTIAPAMLARVDWAIAQLLDRGLNVVLNVHHYDELSADPAGHETRYLALWGQLAARYAEWPARLCFELLNEPRDALVPARWNALLARALTVVRASNPDRAVLVGPARMNTVEALPELVLPRTISLVVTVHYYAPMEFTHQGAAWTAGADQWLGTTWGDDADRAAVRRDLAAAAAWAGAQGHPLFIGEFGA